MNPIRLAGIVGSLRSDSSTRAVFRAAAELVGADVELVEVPLADVPLYDGDVEAEGDPAAVVGLKGAIDAADGLIVFTPEYNRSVPAVTKNAIDWLSRPPGDSVLSRAAVGIVAATPGGHDAQGVRSHLSASIAANTDRFHESTHGIASVAAKLIDGRLVDPEARTDLETWLAGFVAEVRELAHV